MQLTAPADAGRLLAVSQAVYTRVAAAPASAAIQLTND